MRVLALGILWMVWLCPLPSNAESNEKQILKHFPRWVECESGRASWKQVAPVFSEGLVQVAAFEITIQLPGKPPVSEAATGTSFGNFSQIRSWNYSVTWTTGGFSFSGEEEGFICINSKHGTITPGFSMGGFQKGAEFRVRDDDGKPKTIKY